MIGGFTNRKINSITRVNQNTLWVTLEGTLDAQPGQFVMVWLPGIGEKPFSIASIEPFGLLVVDVGPFSHALHQLSVGNPLWVKGPLGQGFSMEGEQLLLVGGGYGSAPLLPLAKTARAMNKRVEVCLGAQNASGVLLLADFERLNCKVSVSTDDGSLGEKGLVTMIVEQAIQTSDFDTLYACGPASMLSALAKLCSKHKLDYQLSWEAHMRCGMGLCGSCEVPQAYDQALPVGWLACYDGPVFYRHWASKPRM
jgi:dihydroorotate dehydrogenase electron transfer subunit